MREVQKKALDSGDDPTLVCRKAQDEEEAEGRRADLELRIREPGHTVTDCGPGKPATPDVLVGRTQIAAAPDGDLDPVGTLFSEYDLDTGMRVNAELPIGMRGRSIVPGPSRSEGRGSALETPNHRLKSIHARHTDIYILIPPHSTSWLAV